MYSHFSFVLALKTIDPQMLFWSVFFWNFGIGLLKSYLTLGYFTCSVWSKKMSTLHPNAQVLQIHELMLRNSRYTSSCSGTADTRAHAQVQQIHKLTLRYSRYTSSCSGTADNQAHAHCSVGWSVEIFFDRSEQVN